MIFRTVVEALIKPIVALFALVAVWFAGSKSASNVVELKDTKQQLKTSVRSKEIENEVEALDPDALKSRARKWVRGSNK